MIFHPTYFSSIYQFALMISADKFVFEIHDNFQKQTYRNRCYIYGANGKQLLNIPIQKITGKQSYKDVKIDYSENWQSVHLKALYSAYNSSPFFEFYIDELLEIFKTKEIFLIDLNIKTTLKVVELLQEKIVFSTTNTYLVDSKNDYRYLVNAKQYLAKDFPKYTQIFDKKHGFLQNLSILDLLFMKGPASMIYLEKLIRPYIQTN